MIGHRPIPMRMGMKRWRPGAARKTAWSAWVESFRTNYREWGRRWGVGWAPRAHPTAYCFGNPPSSAASFGFGLLGAAGAAAVSLRGADEGSYGLRNHGSILSRRGTPRLR